jgi:uncharacterized protein YjcR
MPSPPPFIPPATATAIRPPEVTPDAPAPPRRRARSLYWQGWGISQIAEELDLPISTISSWKGRDKWDEASSVQKIEDHLECRLAMLIAKDKKTGHDFKEMDALFRGLEKTARRQKFLNGGNEVDLNPNVANRNAPEVKDKKKKGKNLIDREGLEQLEAAFHRDNFFYQETWWANVSRRTRFILKSRQIGATWYFAREALLWGLKTGHNQIFLSASRNQANVFREYIVAFVEAELGITLRGNPLVIQRGVDDKGEQLAPFTMYFLGTNSRTAQSYSGDVYIDEAFWIYGFEKLETVASGMATHKRFRKTYFSTPSVIAHEAYAKWSGEKYNHRRAKADRAKFDISHAALKDGVEGADRIWRQIITIDDAIAGGLADLVDRDELMFEYSLDEFDLLFLCHFLDDSQSVFPHQMMMRCGVDVFREWKDFNEYSRRPFGEGEVWIGYDPNGESGQGDEAGLIVAAPPAKAGGKFRLLEKKRFRGKDYQEQAAEIKAMCGRYNVTHIAIDTTGIGSAVYSLVSAWFPAVRAIRYSPEVKAMMVYKAKKVIADGRLQFASHWQDVINSFMSIRPHVTRSNKSVTFVASRSGSTGHADLAWAAMHVLFNEALDPNAVAAQSVVELC